MATVDIYAITDKLDDTLLKVLATRLEARGQHPSFQAMLTEYLDAINIDVARTILDIGCGTGVAARAIARRKGFTGIDLSAGLVQSDFWLSALESFRKLIPKAGAMSEQEAAGWVAGLLEDSGNGVFFGACNYYSYVATRPQSLL